MNPLTDDQKKRDFIVKSISDQIEKMRIEIDKHFHNSNELLYHYTNLEALLGILENDHFRLSNVYYMNDPEELNYGLNLFSKIYNKNFKNDFEKIKYIQINNDYKYSNVFALSLTSSFDSLPQWRMYGNNGYGICLGIDLTKIEDKPRQVIYSEEKQEEVINQFFKYYIEITKNNLKEIKEFKLEESYYNFFTSLSQYYSSLLKNKTYSSEDEYRVTIIPDLFSDTNSIEKAMKFRISNNIVIPYIESNCGKLAINSKKIKKIIIGPKIDFELNEYSLKEFLNKNNKLDIFNKFNIDILKSEIKMR